MNVETMLVVKLIYKIDFHFYALIGDRKSNSKDDLVVIIMYLCMYPLIIISVTDPR